MQILQRFSVTLLTSFIKGCFYRYLFGYQQQIYEKQSSFWTFVETILRQKQALLIPNWGYQCASAAQWVAQHRFVLQSPKRTHRLLGRIDTSATTEHQSIPQSHHYVLDQ